VVADRLWLRLLAGLVMGVAVTGMHYTGMAAVRAHLDPAAPAPPGVEVFTFLLPIFVIAAVLLAGTITAVLMAAPEEPEILVTPPDDTAGEPVGTTRAGAA
jgi:NO-binding membrane sensor protein with MHYT domain